MEVKPLGSTCLKEAIFTLFARFSLNFFKWQYAIKTALLLTDINKRKDVVACRAACRNRNRGIANNPPEIAINGLDYWFRANSLPALIASMFRGIRPWWRSGSVLKRAISTPLSPTSFPYMNSTKALFSRGFLLYLPAVSAQSVIRRSYHPLKTQAHAVRPSYLTQNTMW